MTELQIENGFWVPDKANGFPPDSISYPMQYKGEAKINIACTQRTGFTPTEEKKLIKEWCDFLPKCSNIELVWFTTKIPQQLFDSICLLEQLIGLNIKNSSISSLGNLANLKNLKYLRIGDSSKIINIEPLKSLTNLEVLVIENFKNISDFSILRQLTSLKFLTIEGGMYTKQKVDSFEPISELKNLLYLSTAMISSSNKSIEPILKLKSLITLNWPFDLGEQQMVQLKKDLPKLKYLPHRHVQSNFDKIKALFK